MVRAVIVFAGLAVGLSPVALGTQTAFWRPYEADGETHLLMRFEPPDPARVEGETGKAELTGDAAPAPEGRFGGGLKLAGKGAVKVEAKTPYRGGAVAIEAWLKLDRYPEKAAYIVHRPAVADRDARYDPKVDKTKGFGLFIDARGALHLETTNLFYGKRTVTSSPAGVVPLGKWVHVAGISAVYRRLYVDGREVASVAIQWGEGLAVHGDEESEAGPLYVGNDASGNAGLSGLLDEVRVHRNLFRLWEREDTAWARANDAREIPTGPPFFVPEHPPVLYLPLDGDLKPARCEIAGLKPEAKKTEFVEGVRNKGLLGPFGLSAPGLLDLKQGSLEFWFQPYGVNNWSDRNRGFVSAGVFTLYIFNGGDPGRPISLYYANPYGGLEFLNHEDDYYEGRWRHAVITWRGREVCLYIDGRLAARSTAASLATPGNKGVSDTIHFGEAMVDKVYVYRHALLPEEVANAFWRYRDPARLTRDVQLDCVEVEGMFFPSDRKLLYRLIPNVEPATIRQVVLTLKSPTGRRLLSKKVPFSAEASSLELPRLGEGLHSLVASVVDQAGETTEGGAFTFDRKVFPWEGTELGISDEVPLPFTPVSVQDRWVSVVGRTYTMGDAGLWDKVVAERKDLLNGPMRLRYWTRGNEGKWEKTSGRFTSRRRSRAVFEGRASAPALTVQTRSTIEVDGCMRVEMTLSPGPRPEPIERLWLDIPLLASEARLLHETTDTLRQNFAGAVPEGQGVVWDSRKGHRTKSWRNAFTAYVWLGNPNRGLACFAENDRGWVTRKDHKEPLQEVIREGDRVILRVHLINQPVTIKEPRTLVFGLQASPTKPMPDGWRARLPDMPTGLAVVPFGGLNCSYQGPYRDDWAIVDKIAEARATGKVDSDWFTAYAKEHTPPPAHGTWPWLGSVLHFAGRAKDVGPRRPLTVYHEEMAACTVRDEWKVFADEWTVEPFAFRRGPLTQPDEAIFRSGRNTNPSATVNFGRSYQDFGCWFANEWLKRGISLYWDNTYPRSSMNPLNSAAYVTEDGSIQPAVILWNQREYQKRVWNLLQQWRKKRPEPLEWVNHMTNTLVLPIHTWATANLDHELGSAKPFSPEWLQAETVGRQVGTYPLTLYAVTGSQNAMLQKLPQEKQYRAEWGMRMAHEIQSNGGKLFELVRQFGYATDAVRVANYWADEPVLSIEPPQVKWLAMLKTQRLPKSSEAIPVLSDALIVLASWAEEDVKASVRLVAHRIGRVPDKLAFTDAEDGSAVDPAAVALPGPYGARILRVRADKSSQSN
ncbi:MAG: LamG domain-containing protein [Planctomycetes bacterium]|nr:LamG domain-containing protein [Planctomycetota bacterium]